MPDEPDDPGGDLVGRLESQDPASRERAFAQVYDTMREIARAYLERERKDHTLSPTDVVNEACLRLLGNTRDDITQGRLVGFAAHTMRVWCNRSNVPPDQHLRRLWGRLTSP